MIPNILKDNFALLADTPGGVQKLRELVLRLAVQGKFTSARHDGWKNLRLADVVESITGGGTPRKNNAEYWGGGIPWASVKDLGARKYLNETQDTITKKGLENSSSNLIPKGRVIVCTRMGLGKIAINRIAVAINQDLKALALKRDVDIDFFYNLYRTLNIEGTGMTVAGIRQDALLNLSIKLPPFAEQKQIVAKVDELMALCDELEARQEEAKKVQSHLNGSALARLTQSADCSNDWKIVAKNFQCLEKTPKNVSELRKTILQVAMMGRLVPCEQSSDSADVSVVRDFVRFLNGYAFQSGWFQARGVRLARNVNVSHGFLDWNDAAFIDEVRAKEFTQFNLLAGDILVSLDRPLISTGLKVAVVRQADLPCLLLQRVAKTEFVGQDVFPPYFFLWLNSPLFTGSIDPGRSKGVPHISTRQIEALPFNPPPLAEQKRIVAKVDELMKLCDELEALMKRAESDGARLFDAVVKGLMAV